MRNSRFKMQTRTERPVVLFAFCLLHFALLVSLSACSAKAKAQTLPDGPPLAVPVAPEHSIVIEQVAEAPPPEPEPEVIPAQPPARPPATGTRTPITKPAPKPENTPAVTPPAVVPPPAPEPQVIRAQPAAAAGDERKVQELVKKAAEDLTHVDYKKLSKDGQSQYDQSKRFSDQAQQALKERNVPYALTLAEKAATLAAELVR